MTTNRLAVTDLDFDTIKQNLKEYLRSQSTFTDYNFEGSGINVLLDILAYNTHYNAYYQNMVANESFLDSAILRNSAVSHAKSLGYTPRSTSAAKAIIDFTVNLDPFETTIPDSVLLPRGFTFRSNLVNNTSYNFCLLDDISVSRIGYTCYFKNLEIYEGQLINYVYTYNADTNTKGFFTIPSKNVDINTIRVIVQNSSTDLENTTFTRVNDVLDVDADSEIYFIQEGLDEKYEIYFGNGVIGKAINDGSIISISYLVTSGEEGNDCSSFTMSSSAFTSLSYDISVLAKSGGGAAKENLDSIKFNAMSQFVAQNRLVTSKDYETYLISRYPAIESVSVWGGETNVPPVYGKVFISIKPKENYYIPAEEKALIIQDIIQPKMMITTDAIIIDPEYLYVKIETSVKYNNRKTTLTENELKTQILNAIYAYADNNLNTFSSTLVISKLQEYIDSVNLNAILGCETYIRVEKRVVPYVNQLRTYTVEFNVPLYRGTTLNRLESSNFIINDFYGIARSAFIEEVPESYTGISAIQISNSGYNYLTAPTITITGDGYGATATAKIINGKVVSIDITNRGINYTKAIINFSGGDGIGAEAEAILNTNFGTLRTVYFNELAERIVLEPNAGTINYTTGTVIITDLNIQQMNTYDNLLRLNILAQGGILSSVRNTILTLDQHDQTSVVISMSSQ